MAPGTQVITTVTPPNARHESPSSRRPRDFEDPANQVGAGAAAAFEALLDVTREFIGPKVGGRGMEIEFAERMFDSPLADARARRQAELKREFRTELQERTGRPRSDRPDTRRARPEGRCEFVGSDARPGRQLSRSEHALDNASKPGIDDALPRSLPEQWKLGAREPDSGSGARNDAGGGGGRSALTSSAPAAGGLGAAAPGTASRPVLPVVQGASNGANLAEHLGRVLGEGRAHGGESARAAEASSASCQTGDHAAQTKADRGTRPGATQAREARHAEMRRALSEKPVAFKDLVRAIQIRSGERHSTARLRLDPPELGRMRVDVSLHHDRLHVEVRTETAEATQLMTERVGALKTALAAHGVTVEQFDVSYHDPAMEQFGAGYDGSAHEQYQPRIGTWDDRNLDLDRGPEDGRAGPWETVGPPGASVRHLIDVSV